MGFLAELDHRRGPQFQLVHSRYARAQHAVGNHIAPQRLRFASMI